MKTLPLLMICAVLPLAAVAQISQNASVLVTHEELQASTRIEAAFPQAMVGDAEVGRPVKGALVEITPAWKGEWVWDSPRVASWKPVEIPKFNTTYRFAVRSRLKDLSGSTVGVDAATEIRTPAFGLERYTQVRMAEDAPQPAPRQSPRLLVFNGPVNASGAAAALSFVSEEGGRVAATARLAKFSEMDHRGRHRFPWAQAVVEGTDYRSFDEESPEPEADSVVSFALVVTPAEPLPVGTRWQVVGLEKLSAAGDAKATVAMEDGSTVLWGTVAPGIVNELHAESGLNLPNTLRLDFDKHVAAGREDYERWIRVDGLNTAPEIEVRGHSVYVRHEHFSFNRTYRVIVTEGLPMADGLELSRDFRGSARFEPEPGSIYLPSSEEILLLHGSGRYALQHVNLSKVRVRVREVPAENELLVRQAYGQYVPDANHTRSGTRVGMPVTFALLPGRDLMDKTHDVRAKDMTNKTRSIDLNMTDLTGDKSRPATLFLQAEGFDSIHSDATPVVVAQAMVQVSDIGFAWKSSLGAREAVLFVFSHRTGKPLAGVSASGIGSNGEVLAEAVSDGSGLARLTFDRKQHPTAILLAKGEDRNYFKHFTLDSMGFSPWRMGVSNFSWEVPSDTQIASQMFSDRSLYRPGETAHLAGFIRKFQKHLPQVPVGYKAQLVLHDPRSREVARVDVEADAHGMISHDFALPHEPAGYYRVVLRLTGEDNKVKHQGHHFFLVQDFTRNTFEVTMPLADSLVAPGSIDTRVEAAYLLGAPVNGGDLSWTAWFQSRGFYPAQHRDFLFGDHRQEDWNYWYHYFGRGFEDSHSGRRAAQSGQAVLDGTGVAAVSIPVPPDPEFPSLRMASVFAEVTDGRQQTLATRGEVEIHPADFYLGVSRPPSLVKENSALALDLLAVDPKGEVMATGREFAWTLEKRVWNAVEIAHAGGATSIRREESLERVAEGAVTLDAGRGKVAFQPGDAGEYFLTLDGSDEAGRPVRTSLRLNVYGKGNDSWVAARHGEIEVLPDKRSYQPGDTARLLVKSPIGGTALVTIERDTVERSFLTNIGDGDSLIDVPLTDLDAPNIHVGVTLVQGSADSGLAHPMPRMRAGYATLVIEHSLAGLAVEVSPRKPSVLPGDHAHVEIAVRDSQGRAVPDARVVFYAVDEGTLAVMGYENPDLLSVFHPQRPLRVRSGSSLGRLLSEDPEGRYYGNKGYIIGGGDDTGGMSGQQTRRDFQPCAVWRVDLTTNAQGKCVLAFITPDTLTRYRMIAVAASADGWRFGTGVGAVEVSKPLMIEPAVPRFAHMGDTARVRAQVFNQTNVAGRFAATLRPDSHAMIQGPSVVEIDLGPGENGPVEFVVRFTEPGRATWRWDLEPRSWSGTPEGYEEGDLADSMESGFDIHHPIPTLRENRVFTLNPGATLGMLEGFDPLLRAGEGAVTVRVSNTRLLDALEASRFLRRYPYGCAEQTISGMVPWVASHALRKLMPDAPDEAETAKAMEIGCRRLATMLTRDGGLGYWPGAYEPSLWATVHAAHILVLARDNGLIVPDTLLEPMLDYLAAELRGMMDKVVEEDLRPERVRALMVLAMAGNADAAYQNKLIAAKDKLPTDSLLYLVMALAATDPDDEAIPGLLAATSKSNPALRWYPGSQLQALRLGAVTAANLPRAQVDAELEKLLNMRDSMGHWSTTFSNSWALLSMARYHQKFEANFGSATPVLTWAGDSKELPLAPHASQSSIDIGLADLAGEGKLDLSLAEGDTPVYVSVTLAARPQEMPPKAAVPGLAINRSYKRVAPDGTLEPVETFQVGDLVAVELTLEHKGDLFYLVVDDPLPACLEAIHPDFVSRVGEDVASLVPGNWTTSHSELRDERAVFFCDRLRTAGESKITYLARVIRAGEFFAPPPLAEAMYDPSTRSLGEGIRVAATPRAR